MYFPEYREIKSVILAMKPASTKPQHLPMYKIDAHRQTDKCSQDNVPSLAGLTKLISKPTYSFYY